MVRMRFTVIYTRSRWGASAQILCTVRSARRPSSFTLRPWANVCVSRKDPRKSRQIDSQTVNMIGTSILCDQRANFILYVAAISTFINQMNPISNLLRAERFATMQMKKSRNETAKLFSMLLANPWSIRKIIWKSADMSSGKMTTTATRAQHRQLIEQ